MKDLRPPPPTKFTLGDSVRVDHRDWENHTYEIVDFDKAMYPRMVTLRDTETGEECEVRETKLVLLPNTSRIGVLAATAAAEQTELNEALTNLTVHETLNEDTEGLYSVMLRIALQNGGGEPIYNFNTERDAEKFRFEMLALRADTETVFDVSDVEKVTSEVRKLNEDEAFEVTSYDDAFNDASALVADKETAEYERKLRQAAEVEMSFELWFGKTTDGADDHIESFDTYDEMKKAFDEYVKTEGKNNISLYKWKNIQSYFFDKDGEEVEVDENKFLDLSWTANESDTEETEKETEPTIDIMLNGPNKTSKEEAFEALAEYERKLQQAAEETQCIRAAEAEPFPYLCVVVMVPSGEEGGPSIAAFHTKEEAYKYAENVENDVENEDTDPDHAVHVSVIESTEFIVPAAEEE